MWGGGGKWRDKQQVCLPTREQEGGLDKGRVISLPRFPFTYRGTWGPPPSSNRVSKDVISTKDNSFRSSKPLLSLTPLHRHVRISFPRARRFSSCARTHVEGTGSQGLLNVWGGFSLQIPEDFLEIFYTFLTFFFSRCINFLDKAQPKHYFKYLLDNLVSVLKCDFDSILTRCCSTTSPMDFLSPH